jgi:2'-5' RNA ligase
MELTENAPKPKLRYWIAFFFKNLEVGDGFKPGLLHLTVITWFVSDYGSQEVENAFERDFARQRGLTINVGGIADFKHKRKVTVNLVKPTPKLLGLHQKALDFFTRLNGRWAVRSAHMDDEYIPHIRRRPGKGYKEGDELKIDAIYLIKAARTEDGQRTVAAKVDLA